MYVVAIGLQAKPGKGPEAGEAVVELRELIKSAAGVDANAWAGLLGLPPGAFMVSARFDTVAEYGRMVGALRGNDDYRAFAARQGEAMDGHLVMVQNQIIHAAGYTAIKPVIESFSATMQSPWSASLQWCTEAVDHHSAHYGGGGFVAVALAGKVDQVNITFGYDSLDHLDEIQAKRAADTERMDLFDAATGKFVDGATESFVAVLID